jgi:hypothetical protein
MSLSNATSDNAAGLNDGTASPVRRFVPRGSHACETCRLKKARCDQQTPCSFCQKHSVNCVYSLRKNGQSFSSRPRDASPRIGARVPKQKRNATSTIFRHSKLSPAIRGGQRDDENGYDALAVETRSPSLQSSVGQLSKDPENRPPVEDRR